MLLCLCVLSSYYVNGGTELKTLTTETERLVELRDKKSVGKRDIESSGCFDSLDLCY